MLAKVKVEKTQLIPVSLVSTRLQQLPPRSVRSKPIVLPHSHHHQLRRPIRRFRIERFSALCSPRARRVVAFHRLKPTHILHARRQRRITRPPIHITRAPTEPVPASIQNRGVHSNNRRFTRLARRFPARQSKRDALPRRQRLIQPSRRRRRRRRHHPIVRRR